MDSSLISAVSGCHKTFTVGFSDAGRRYDETLYTKELAECIGVENHCRYIGKNEFLEAVPDVVYHLDEPLGDASAIALYFLAKEASKQVKVVLSGEGADDYITKPFELREVTARVKTILRRTCKMQTGHNEIRIGNVIIYEQECIVTINGNQVELTVKEYNLLLWLVKNPRKVFTRAALLDEVWGYDFFGGARTVDVHIQRLRKKLDLSDSIVTVFGVGYKYVPKE